jgi:maltose O-acetyltransferase
LFVYYFLLRKWRKELGGDVLRSFVCRFIFRKLGKDAVVKRNVSFGRGNKISLGINSYIGEDSYLNIHDDIIIGANVMIGPQVMILTGNHSFSDISRPMCEQPSIGLSVIIKDNVWIGARSIILPGVMIGEGAVIGAGSVVTKDIGELSVVAGNPARLIRNRLSQEKDAASTKNSVP